jgi:hypothetical protein
VLAQPASMPTSTAKISQGIRFMTLPQETWRRAR